MNRSRLRRELRVFTPDEGRLAPVKTQLGFVREKTVIS
jgi:hypothetical protein